MNLAMAGVVGAALCSGAAAVLQTSAVRSLPTQTTVSAGFLGRLARNPRYLLALALIAAGFLLSLLALRTLPLFVVQAGRASGLAVTAVLSVVVLHARLRRVEALAVGVVVVGLVALAFAAGVQRSAEVSSGVRFGLLAAVLVLGVAGLAALRAPVSRASGVALAVAAGLGFGLLALGARIVPVLTMGALLTDPAAWAAGLGGALGLLLGAFALQRASVVAVTGCMVGTETVVAAALGMLICGDRPLPGRGAVALLGFVLVLAGALLLARFGAPEHASSDPEEQGALPIG